MKLLSDVKKTPLTLVSDVHVRWYWLVLMQVPPQKEGWERDDTVILLHWCKHCQSKTDQITNIESLV